MIIPRPNSFVYEGFLSGRMWPHSIMWSSLLHNHDVNFPNNLSNSSWCFWMYSWVLSASSAYIREFPAGTLFYKAVSDLEGKFLPPPPIIRTEKKTLPASFLTKLCGSVLLPFPVHWPQKSFWSHAMHNETRFSIVLWKRNVVLYWWYEQHQRSGIFFLIPTFGFSPLQT